MRQKITGTILLILLAMLVVAIIKSTAELGDSIYYHIKELNHVAD